MKKFRINEIFYSLQGEGHNTGRAAIFIRFAGCNLRCPFCDTEFDSYREMTADDIIASIAPYPARFVVLTGGEPTLQADEAFVDLLHQHGYEVAMESNGTRPAPHNLDWLTVSPKSLPLTPSDWRGDSKAMGGSIARGNSIARGDSIAKGDAQDGLANDRVRMGKAPDEIKVVFENETSLHQLIATFPLQSEGVRARLFLQPCDTGDAERNKLILRDCIDYIQQHPEWRLSLQTHKLIDIK